MSNTKEKLSLRMLKDFYGQPEQPKPEAWYESIPIECVHHAGRGTECGVCQFIRTTREKAPKGGE
jgi:hypothetical protein